MRDKVVNKTKAQLHEMLAEAVRNTQRQPVTTQPEPIRDERREPKRKKQSRSKQGAPKRASRIKRPRR
jgi:hypothetical protein